MSHAKFPPSAAERWLVCPLTAKLSAMFPDTPNQASILGTMKHEQAAKHLEAGTRSDDPKMQLYLDAVRAEPGELAVERKITIVPDVCWGTSDAYVVAPRKLTIFDLKWGKAHVHATNNPQLLTYGNGVLREVLLPRDTPAQLVIVQPNASTGWPVKRWDTTVGDILTFKQKIVIAIEAANQPNPKGVPGAHCFWCPGKMHCPEYLKAQGASRKNNS